MGQLKKAKVMFTCEHEIKDLLNELAAKEKRTLSNFVEMLVTEALATRQQLDEVKK